MTGPAHLVPLADGWSLWRWMRLRGAGFPAAGVRSLAAPELAAKVDRALDAEPAEAAETVRHALELEAPRLGRVLRDAVRQPLFREALAWQNRQALHTAMDALLATPEGAADKRTRQRELLVASYLQRYCVKNDTIGFFGPVGWGRVDPEMAGVVSLTAGQRLVATRTISFEHWAVDLLAQRLAEDPGLRPLLAPRRWPTLRLEGTVLRLPNERSHQLPPEVARALELCDGERPAREIAQVLASEGLAEVADEEAGLELLQQLAERKLITWTLEVPPRLTRPEKRLRELLEERNASGAAEAGLRALAPLEAAQRFVAQAAGDAAAIEAALDAADLTFTELTGSAAARRPGQTYAGRGILYEDCRRDLELAMGQGFLARLGPPLLLLLRSARWFTHSVAAGYRAHFEALHAQLAAGGQGPSVDFLQFRERAEEAFTGSQAAAPPIVRGVVKQLSETWAELLRLPEAGPTVSRTVAELAPGVAAAFAAPGPGWPLARYHSPDVLVAAEGLDAFRRGDYLPVLGEMHASANTLLTQVAVSQHPSPESLLEARARDVPAPGVAIVEAKEHVTRADYFSMAAHDVDVEVGATRSWRPRSQVVPVAELVVVRDRENLRVRTRDGRRDFDVIAFYETRLLFSTLAHFRLLPPAPYTPRIVVDGVVLARRTWRLPPAELAFAHRGDRADRLIGARRWARDLSLPRYLFFRVPEEAKPCFLDLQSPHYVELFARIVKQASAVTLTEMLPSPEQLWLEDRERRRYACELRFAAVDPIPWRDPLAQATA